MSEKAHTEHDIIAALSSGGGSSAIAMIRVSDSACHEVLQNILIKKDSTWQANQMYLCSLIEPKTKTVLDQPMAVFYKNPHSYTGQDSCEIFLHAGSYIVRRVLELLFSLGIRLADPGEFTRRAFLSGKIDLTRAEGIAALVEASTEQQWLAGRYLSAGRLAGKLDSLRAAVVDVLAYFNAMIDFPDEEETSALDLSDLEAKVLSIQSSIEQMLGSFQNGRMATEGLRIVLFGEPNAGKSTLLNKLLGEDRAIVDSQPGTTRDYIEESCLIDGRLIRLIDTAGVRTTAGHIEQKGIDKAYELVEGADLVLVLQAADGSHSDWLKSIQEQLKEKDHLLLLTKADLGTDNLKQLNFNSATDPLAVSCLSGLGLDELKTLITNRIDSGIQSLKNESYITSVRQQKCLKEAVTALERFWELRSEKAYEEILAFELQSVARSLAEVVGKIDNEDILDKVFSSFCLGK